MYDIGAGVRFGEAIDLVSRLANTPGTHLHAELNDWGWPATLAEVSQILHAQAFMNANRDTKEHPQPFELPMPWDKAEPVDEGVSDDERERLRRVLAEHSAFA